MHIVVRNLKPNGPIVLNHISPANSTARARRGFFVDRGTHHPKLVASRVEQQITVRVDVRFPRARKVEAKFRDVRARRKPQIVFDASSVSIHNHREARSATRTFYLREMRTSVRHFRESFPMK